jgi:DNA-binding PadR family transcriptional regulator
VSAIYITLTRLEGKGLVSSWMGPPTDARGGKAKRHFKVAPAGMAALNETRARLMSMWDGVEDALRVAATVAYAD